MKILVIRFSSIGDIVLTTPVIRTLKQQVKNAEIHFLTKKSFVPVIEHNPYIDKLHAIEKNVSEVIPALKKENYDLVIDLHNNVRSLRVKKALGKKSFSFDKLNFKKWLLVNFKINKMPAVHIVDRYMETVKSLGVKNDNRGLDFFSSEKDKLEIGFFPASFQKGFNALVLGGNYFTKQIPYAKLEEICRLSELPLVLLGGKTEAETGKKLQSVFGEKVFDLAGKLTLGQSAAALNLAEKVITSDTGLMHIAAALKKNIISIWGNTIPEFGMTPYLPGPDSKILEIKGLSCRPCSKLGHRKCPKGHFKCMNEIKIEI
jgi:ADP-heptose:LPS heptosyltransferase